jgi:voltage-gated potassium channel
MQQMIEAMNGHFIVCGAGQAGIAVLSELTSTQRAVVLIESDAAQAAKVSLAFPSIPILAGDFTDDEILLRAGVVRAAGVVMCVDDDKDALVGTVTARQLNPSLRIVARATDEHAMARLRNAGADAVVSPGIIGGMRLASELVRPSVVGFLDQMLRDKNRNLRIEEVDVAADSPFANRTVGELDAGRAANLMLLAVRDPGSGEYVYNPPPTHRITPGSRLIVMGDPNGVLKLRDITSGNHPAVATR